MKVYKQSKATATWLLIFALLSLLNATGSFVEGQWLSVLIWAVVTAVFAGLIRWHHFSEQKPDKCSEYSE